MHLPDDLFEIIVVCLLLGAAVILGIVPLLG